MSILSGRLKYVNCNVWDTVSNGFTFPEEAIPEIAGRANVGLAFSGGGTRSAAATIGQIRALHEIGVMDSVKYISCVSGGAWACVPYSYLPSGWTDDTFLGMYMPPRELSADLLAKTDRNSFLHAVANSTIIDDFIGQAAMLAGDETYSRAAGAVFLSPFNIASINRFFTYDDDTLAGILARNDEMVATDFQTVRPGRPFLIVGSIILRLENPDPLPTRIPFETTPLYVGTRKLYERAGSGRRNIGGRYVEPFGFDSDETDRLRSGRPLKVRLGAARYRYTLSDVIGATAAAPAEILARVGLDWVGLPEYKYWPPSSPKIRAKEYTFGDGGILENLGIMPLLARKVERIVIFVNTQHRLTGGGEGQINGSIPPLFGQTPGFADNHIFPADQYRNLVDGLLQEQAQGKTLMFQDRYTVLDNAFHGIEGGWDVDVLWIYNARVPRWEGELPDDVRHQIGVGSLGNFPHYRTFLQNPPAIIDLSAKQASMLAHLSSWNVMENRDIFTRMLT